MPPATATPSPSAAAFPLSLTDDEGTLVELPTEPRKIVSLTPATTELVFALGAGDRLVGGTDFDDYPPEAVDLPDVATFTSVDVEQILALGADLVLAGGNSFNPPAAIEQLRRVGVPVLVVYAPTVDGVLTDIELVGRAIGAGDEAADMTASMRAHIDQVRTAVEGLARPRVFYELDATQEIFGPADDSFIAEMVDLAGGEPITTGSPTVFSIPLERLVEADPDVIVLGDAAYGVTAEQVAARPGWGTMTAVTTCAIRPVDDLLVTRPGPRLAEGLRLLALAIHPEADLPAPSPPGSPQPSAAPSPAASGARC
jgi:iron complex transport system substrate-binding protein